jgi:acetyl esterase/lipase
VISFASPRLFALALLLLAGLAGAQTVPAGKSRLFLWAGRYTPIASPKPSNISDTTAYSPTDSVRNSWLLHYAAANPNGAAMIVIPGGGYANLAPWTSEGVPAANALTGYGVTVFILRYRVQPYAYPHAMWDVQRAVRWVRANAAAYGIDPNRVGVLGYSAGGHVASTAATHFDAGLTDSNAANGPHWYPGRKDSIDLYSSRPNFQALIYPMTTMVRYRPGTTNDEYAYGPGRTIYIGTNASAALVDYTSNEKQVTPQTPPAFINWGTGDALVDTLNSTAYRDSLISKGVHVKTVVVAGGAHDPSTAKLDSLRAWLNAQGYFAPTSIRAGRTRTKIPAPAWVASGKGLDVLGRLSDRPTGKPLKAMPSSNRRD